MTFSVPIVFAKERPRRARSGHFYTPKATREGEDLVAWYTRQHVKDTFTGPVQVTLVFKTNRKHIDLDNAIKGSLDGIEKGGGFKNDRQVRRIGAWLDAGEPEETLVTITDLEEAA